MSALFRQVFTGHSYRLRTINKGDVTGRLAVKDVVNAIQGIFAVYIASQETWRWTIQVTLYEEYERLNAVLVDHKDDLYNMSENVYT